MLPLRLKFCRPDQLFIPKATREPLFLPILISIKYSISLPFFPYGSGPPFPEPYTPLHCTASDQPDG